MSFIPKEKQWCFSQGLWHWREGCFGLTIFWFRIFGFSFLPRSWSSSGGLKPSPTAIRDLTKQKSREFHRENSQEAPGHEQRTAECSKNSLVHSSLGLSFLVSSFIQSSKTWHFWNKTQLKQRIRIWGAKSHLERALGQTSGQLQVDWAIPHTEPAEAQQDHTFVSEPRAGCSTTWNNGTAEKLVSKGSHGKQAPDLGEKPTDWSWQGKGFTSRNDGVYFPTERPMGYRLRAEGSRNWWRARHSLPLSSFFFFPSLFPIS